AAIRGRTGIGVRLGAGAHRELPKSGCPERILSSRTLGTTRSARQSRWHDPHASLITGMSGPPQIRHHATAHTRRSLRRASAAAASVGTCRMLKSRAASSFWKRYHELPDGVQRLADRAYAVWSRDPRHPSLRFKPFKINRWSARLGDHYRAVGRFMDGNTF